MQYLDRANLQLTEPMFFVVDHSYVLHFTILCIWYYNQAQWEWSTTENIEIGLNMSLYQRFKATLG